MTARALAAPVAFAAVTGPRRPGERVARAVSGTSPLREDAVDAICEAVAEAGEPHVAEDAANDEPPIGPAAAELGCRALIAVPLGGGGGALCAADLEAREWSEQDLAAISDLAATATDELRLQAAAAQASLSEEAQRLAGVGTWEWNADTNQVVCSEALYRIWGLDPGQPHMLEDFVARMHPDDRGYIDDVIVGAEQRGEDRYHMEFRIVRPDGDVRWLYTRGEIERDECGRLKRSTGTTQDVTVQRSVARRLEKVESVGQIGTWEWDVPTGRSTLSPQVYRILGVEPGHFPATTENFMRVMHPDDRDLLATALKAAAAGEPIDLTFRIIRPDNGEIRWTRLRGEAPRDVRGKLLRLTGTLQDITEQRRIEALLREAEERFGTTFEATNVGMALVDLDLRRFLRVNHALAAGLRRSEAELLAMSPIELLHPDDARIDEQALADLVAGKRESLEFERRFVMPDGESRVGLVHIGVVRDADDYPLYGVLHARDLTGQREAEEQVVHHALHHPLTGLANRTLFLDRLAYAVDQRERRGAACAVLAIDIDRFRAVNERFGLDRGDEALRTVAARLADGVDCADTVGHLGEDMFALVCDDLADEHAALELAERVQRLVHEPIEVPGDEIVLTASIGVALAYGGERAERLVRQAELAAVAAAERGGNRWEVFDPVLRERLIERIELERELRAGIERGELKLHYQPIARSDGRSLLAHEALVRWEHPTRGLLQPAEFLPVAEETGLDVSLGAYVLEAACRQALAWSDDDPAWEDVGVSVNVTARQLDQPDFVDLVARVLRETGIRPERVRLEITETALMRSADPAGVVEGLRRLGVRVILDDFGTGYSSLSHLRLFPIDELKIDRSFVADVHTDAQSAQIVDAIVSMARALSLRVVAEGVEDSHQLAKVAALGCQAVQGFLIGRPAPADGVRRDWAVDGAGTPPSRRTD